MRVSAFIFYLWVSKKAGSSTPTPSFISISLPYSLSLSLSSQFLSPFCSPAPHFTFSPHSSFFLCCWGEFDHQFSLSIALSTWLSVSLYLFLPIFCFLWLLDTNPVISRGCPIYILVVLLGFSIVLYVLTRIKSFDLVSGLEENLNPSSKHVYAGDILV